MGELTEQYKNCILCPRACGVDRTVTSGYCGMSSRMYIARAALHMWEEPCISGTEGSGAVFFTGCNMGCIFCQNRKISGVDRANQWIGEEVSVEELTGIMLRLQQEGANNINLVTPTHFVPSIVEAIRISKERGLTVPIVYNCGGYESVQTLKILEGYVDIFLPDLKYMDNERALKYSNTKDYVERVKAALDEMYRQVGSSIYDERGIMQRGMIVRHLVLPGGFMDSVHVVDYLWEHFGNGIVLSLMSQYTPMHDDLPYEELKSKVSGRVYDHLVDHVIRLGMENVLIQEGEVAKQSFIPEFNGEGVR